MATDHGIRHQEGEVLENAAVIDGDAFRWRSLRGSKPPLFVLGRVYISSCQLSQMRDYS